MRILALFLVLTTAPLATAQFVQFSVVVDSEVAVNVQNALSFGELSVTDSVDVPLGDTRMGVIQVDGVTDQDVVIRISTDLYLTNADFPDCDADNCRITMRLSYVLSESPTFEGVTLSGLRPLTELDGQRVVLSGPQTGQAGATPISSLYVGIYGAAVSREVIPGNYSGALTLWLEY